jgi:hypothetical protein
MAWSTDGGPQQLSQGLASPSVAQLQGPMRIYSALAPK